MFFEIKSKIRQKLPLKVKVFLNQYLDAIRLSFFRKKVGKSTFIDKTVHVLGWSSIQIGHSTIISEFTWLNVNARIKGHKHILIGNNCYIGKRNFLSAGSQIEIADYCMTGADCKFLGSDHIFDNPYIPYLVSGTTNEKIIRMGVNSRLGAAVIVVGNVSIGHGSVIGAGSLVNKNIPPFCIALGNPCRVIRRYDFVLRQWVTLENYIPERDSAMPSEQEYLETLIRSYPNLTVSIKAASQRAGDLF